LSIYGVCDASTTCTVVSTGGGDDSANILTAFNNCKSGGTIVFSSGTTYHWNTPGTTLPTLSGTTIQIKGTIVFPASTSFSSLDYYVTLKGSNVVVNGGGTLDGNGQYYWNAGKTGGPKVIKFELTGTSTISSISVTNSPAQHISVNGCNGCKFTNVNVNVDSSRLTSGSVAKNTDGFDVGSSTGVQIIDSVINNGDDCVAINGGVYNLLITGMSCTGGHGVSIGSLGSGNANDIVSGVVVSNSVFTSTKYAARIKTYLVNSGNTGYAKNITYSGITVKTPTSSPICITQKYCNNGDCGSGTVAFNLEGATFENFIFTSVSTSNDVVDIYCESSTTCGPFKFTGVTLPSGGKVGCNDVSGTQISGLACSATISTGPCN